MKNLLLIISILLFVACGMVQPTYFGDKLPPTTAVDLYYSAHDVKRPYKVIGHLTIPNIGQEAVKAKLINYAKTIGADAIVITGNTVNDGTKSGSDIVNADALKYESQ
jgi:5,10-methylenetetrahydrofolate reductase